MRRRRWSLLAALLAGLLVALLFTPGIALAHAGLVRTDPPAGGVLPAAPPVVRLWFSEPVTPVGRGITVIAPSGRQVQQGTAVADGLALTIPLDAPETGTYLVRWQVIGSDTHPAVGTLLFSVGHAGTPPAPDALPTGGAVSPWGVVLQALARWLHVAGYALVFGPISLRTLVLGALPDEETPDRRLRRLLRVGLWLLLVAEPLALVAQAVSLGWAPGVLGDVLGSSFGRILTLRLGAALLLWMVQGALEETGRRRQWPLLLIMLALAAVDSGASHTALAGPPVASRALVTLHEVAMGLWVGGLVALLAVWPSFVPGQGRAALVAVVARFGRLAAGAVAVLVISGGALAATQIARPSELITTPYGQVLLAKLAVVGVALGVAAWGRRAADARRSWRVEVGVQALILALAALLGAVPPPR